MAYELKPGQGSAFVNKFKTEDWHAPYKGEVVLPDGTLCFLDIKPGKTQAGEHWFSVKIGKPKPPKAAAPVSEHSQAKANAFVVDIDDDIPF